MKSLITYEEALQCVLDSTHELNSEIIDFREALNRVLDEDLFSDIDIPPFTRSAMDGYACRKADLDKPLKVVEIVAAGNKPTKPIREGECCQIMTGAPIPDGADWVIKVEDTQQLDNGFVQFTGKSDTDNIRKKGEELKAGEKVLEKGTLLGPAQMAIVASVGAVKLKVKKKPEVGIVVTGDELIEPDSTLDVSLIRNSNAYQIMALVQRSYSYPRYYGIIRDDKEQLRKTLRKALSENDVVLFSGGISMGNFDFLPEVMESEGVKILFRKMKVKPGKPTTFGLFNDKLVFGLPGNPVSSFIQFEIIVKPALLKMLGIKNVIQQLELPMGAEKSQSKADRMSWFPVEVKEDGKVYPVKYLGSANILAFRFANAITYFPRGVYHLKKGDRVNVRFI